MFRLSRLTVFLIFIFAAIASFCQHDTLGRHVKGFQAELSTAPWIPYAYPSQEELQAIAPPGIFLNRDLSGYTKQDGAYSSSSYFGGMAGVKVFIHETPRCETFAGLRYGQAIIAGTTYNLSDTDTSAMFIDSLSGHLTLALNEYNSSFYYSVLADRIYVPMGFNFFSSQRRILWVSAGLELCPIINFSYLFQSGITYFRNEVNVRTRNDPQPPRSLSEGGSYFKYQKIDGMSVGAYIGIPIALHLHPFFKTQGTLGKFHAFATLLPVYCFNSSEFGKMTSAFSLVVNTGIRYNLR